MTVARETASKLKEYADGLNKLFGEEMKGWEWYLRQCRDEVVRESQTLADRRREFAKAKRERMSHLSAASVRTRYTTTLCWAARAGTTDKQLDEPNGLGVQGEKEIDLPGIEAGDKLLLNFDPEQYVAHSD